jgi:DNA-nicking Smr family endonuclease
MANKSKTTFSWNPESLCEIRKKVESTPPKKSPQNPQKPTPAPPPLPVHDEPDEDSFRQAMAGVRELPEFQRLSHKPPKKAKRPPPHSAVHLDSFLHETDCHLDVNFRDTDEYMSGYRRGIRPEICDAMHEGKIPAQDCLDLHGMTVEEARLAVEMFIRDARHRGLRCVNVIHGRGLRSPDGPVLKTELFQWLEAGSLRKWVMAYATAPKRNGGPGATYLLLE